MYVPFRQGIIRHQIDNNSNPAFLQKVGGGQFVDLVVSPIPTIFTVAHGSTDYLFEETRTVVHAWGPFTESQDRWLYWDIDIFTGQRTFGFTTKPPIHSSSPPISPQNDQHWFDTSKTTMYVWNGSRWEEKIRLFAAKYDESSIIIPYLPGSQVGLNTPTNAGFILFDDDEKPIKKWRRDNKGEFLTTETPIITHASRVSNVILDGATHICQAVENIPQWSAVCFVDNNRVKLASYMDPRPIAGIVKWNMNVGDIGIIHTSGYITNNNWNWTVPASTPLFVGLSGEITTQVPQTGSIQCVGMVIDSDTIYVSIGPYVKLFNA